MSEKSENFLKYGQYKINLEIEHKLKTESNLGLNDYMNEGLEEFTGILEEIRVSSS